MAEHTSKKKGQLAAAVLAGSALTFSPFAIGLPAAMADEETNPSPAASTASPSPEGTPEASTDPAPPADDETAAGDDGVGDDDAGEGVDPSESATTEAPRDEPSATALQRQNDEGDGDGADLEDEEEVSEEDEADDPVETELSFTINPTFGLAGTDITFSGSDFTPGGDVDVFVFDDETGDSVNYTNVEADEQGNISGSTRITGGYLGGLYSVTATDKETDRSVTKTFVVTDMSLSVTPATLTDEEFLTSGTMVTLEGLEPGETVHIEITPADKPVDKLRIQTEANSAGVVTYRARSTVGIDEMYIGNYDVAVYQYGSQAPAAQGSFEVTGTQTVAPSVELSTKKARPGEDVTVTGKDFSPESTLEISLNPTLDEVSTDGDGAFETVVTIPDDQEPGDYTFTVTNRDNEDETVPLPFEVLAPVEDEEDPSDEDEEPADEDEPADEEEDPTDGDTSDDPSLTIDPERIELDEFIGDPEDGAGVAHIVDGLEPGTEITYEITGPEYVNDYESTEIAEDDGVASFVIVGGDVVDPNVYLGEYNTEVTFVDDEDETQTLSGSFTVVDADDSTGGTGGSGDDDSTDGAGVSDGTGGSTGPVDLNGASGLAQTGATGVQLGLLAGGLLLAGGALMAFANRKRILGRIA